MRTKCVDIAIDLATAVSPTTRNEILSPVYMSLLKDESVAVSAVYVILNSIRQYIVKPCTDLIFIICQWFLKYVCLIWTFKFLFIFCIWKHSVCIHIYGR